MGTKAKFHGPAFAGLETTERLSNAGQPDSNPVASFFEDTSLTVYRRGGQRYSVQPIFSPTWLNGGSIFDCPLSGAQLAPEKKLCIDLFR